MLYNNHARCLKSISRKKVIITRQLDQTLIQINVHKDIKILLGVGKKTKSREEEWKKEHIV